MEFEVLSGVILTAILFFILGYGLGSGVSAVELNHVKLLYNNMSSACNSVIDTANQCFQIVGVSQITQKLGYFEEVYP